MNTSPKKILIIGATGAMATYLIPELLKNNCRVVGVSLDDVVSENENLTYIKSDAKDIDFLKSLLCEKFDAVVDFMIYTTLDEYKKYYELFINNTAHYVFLSTYRVYADDSPLSESSKRLLDVSKPDDYVSEYEYSIYKAEEEDYIRSSPYKNYTIVRPSITYSKRRFQLTTLEADVVVYRMLRGETVVLPQSAMDKQASMTWAGDVAKMFSTIILNPSAYAETYNVASAQHMTWREVAAIYEKIGGLKYVTADDETFLKIVNGDSDFYVYSKQQLMYDRCFNRMVDNSKILKLCNMEQSDLMTLEEGLKKELSAIAPGDIKGNEAINRRMDEYLSKF